MRNKLSRLLFLLLVLILGAGIAVGCSPGTPAPATPTSAPLSQSSGMLVEKLTLDDLAARANSVVLGEAVDVACHKDTNGNIYTLVTFSVEQIFKGETANQVVVSVPGGKLDGEMMEVEDAPNFLLGERAVVFLEKGDGIFRVVGGFQGKLTIDKGNMVGNMPLQDFVEQVKNAVAKQLE